MDHLGASLECRSIPNTPAGHGQLIDWAHTTNAARIAIEGSGTYGRPAAVAAMAAGLDVREVPPQLTARLRRRGRTQTKTDQVDALVVARVALRDHTLAGPTFWKDTEDLRLLVSYRRELVEHRTAQANRLHADLGKLRPGYHHNLPRLTTRKSLDQAMKLLWRDTTLHTRIAKQRIRTLRQLDTQIKELTTEIAELVTQTRTRLLDIHGVGVLVAATILSEVGNPTRYPTKAKFAMANGTAPIEASSGRVVRHRLNRGGNRQINRAIHTAALTQIARTDSEGRRYYQKLITRGKTHREALRVLKRRISDRIWTHLQPSKTSPHLTVRIWGVPFLEVLRLAAGSDVVTLNLTDPEIGVFPMICPTLTTSADLAYRAGLIRSLSTPTRGCDSSQSCRFADRATGAQPSFRKRRREMS